MILEYFEVDERKHNKMSYITLYNAVDIYHYTFFLQLLIWNIFVKVKLQFLLIVTVITVHKSP